MLNVFLNELKANNLYAKMDTVMKDGIEKNAIIIGKEPDAMVHAVLYIDNLAEQLRDNTMMDVINKVKAHLDKGINAIPANLDDFSCIKDKLRLCVAPTVPGKQAVTRDFLDLKLYVRIVNVIDKNVDQFTSAVVTEGIMSTWGVTEDELFSVAQKNMTETYVMTIADLLFGNSGTLLNDCKANELDFSFAVFHEERDFYGAGIMACSEVMAKISDLMGGDFMILPSSVHEVMITQSSNDIVYMANMIREINKTEVKPKDILSNHPYLYVSSIGKVVSLYD